MARRALRAAGLAAALLALPGPATAADGGLDDAGPAPTPPAPAPFENPGGMWMPEQMLDQADTLHALGVTLDPAALADPTGYPLGAVVSLGGCSASFVSADGLVVTNHHCATAALQYGSTPAANLLRDGFLAATPADEKWNGPAARVFVPRSFRDVTSEVRDGLARIAGGRARQLAFEDRTKRLVAACEKGRPGARCSVASYFGGGKLVLVDQLELRDVRLVYAPPSSIGNYGGEIDNWRWPRHTGDFTFFRAYVGPDGAPADHAPANVPYHPARHLTLATQPLGAGDFVMVAGYPGQTGRLRTAGEVEHAVSFTYPRNIAMMEEYLALLDRLGKEQPDLGIPIKGALLIRGLNNQLTKTRGLVAGVERAGVLGRRRALEKQLQDFVAADPGRRRRYGRLLPGLAAIDAERARVREHDAAFEESLRFAKLLSAAVTIVRMAEERAKPDAARDPAYQERNWKRIENGQAAAMKTYDRTLDRALLGLGIERALRLPAAKRPEIVRAVLGARVAAAPAPEIARAVERLYAGTELETEDRRQALLRGATTAELRRSRDPLIRLALVLRPAQKRIEDADKERDGKLLLLRPEYVDLLRAHAPGPVAPDANGTLRLTYGTVRGYRPLAVAEGEGGLAGRGVRVCKLPACGDSLLADGTPAATPFTTLAGVVAKHTGRDPFDAPPALRTAAAAAARDRGRGPHGDPRLGDVPVDFLSDVDITSGSSGSPTLNGRGELVGLAFDGNLEAVASDWTFEPAITRTIHVDLRYVLWVLDAVAGARALLRELGVPPALARPGT